jgi:carbohydrate kinase (thermoresistant glucokinase family)
MQSGIPLTDLDRIDWLKSLNSILIAHKRKNCVLACSALKESYRSLLRKNNNLEIIYLWISKEEVKRRFEKREDHFMPASLIDSQFEALEEPENVTTVEATNAPAAIISEILHRLGYEY